MLSVTDWRLSRGVLVCLALAALGLLVACQEQEPGEAPEGSLPAREYAGPARSYYLGFSSLPSVLTDTGYQQTFDLASQWGEVLLIQRPPSWSDFLPGATLSETQKERTMTERNAARVRGLKLFMALDPFDAADRSRLAALPEGRQGQDLGNGDLKSAFVSEARYIALNYRPAFLALGMEVNATYEVAPEQYAKFLDAYRDAYFAVKDVSPETQVFVTFQYEEFTGVVPWAKPHPPRWELLDGYGDDLDLFGLTTYPSFAYSVARRVPAEYYRQIREHTELPVAFAAVGFSSTPSRDGVNSSTPAEQRRFLQRLIQDADDLKSPLLVWFIGRDASYLTSPPYDLLASIGLRDANDRPKEAWPFWEEAAKRPYDPANASQATPPAEEAPETVTPEATAEP
ncbi:MAG: hypothetical protein AB7L91_04420 [Dehalococcoidia bacterium]